MHKEDWTEKTEEKHCMYIPFLTSRVTLHRFYGVCNAYVRSKLRNSWL